MTTNQSHYDYLATMCVKFLQDKDIKAIKQPLNKGISRRGGKQAGPNESSKTRENRTMDQILNYWINDDVFWLPHNMCLEDTLKKTAIYYTNKHNLVPQTSQSKQIKELLDAVAILKNQIERLQRDNTDGVNDEEIITKNNTIDKMNHKVEDYQKDENTDANVDYKSIAIELLKILSQHRSDNAKRLYEMVRAKLDPTQKTIENSKNNRYQRDLYRETRDLSEAPKSTYQLPQERASYQPPRASYQPSRESYQPPRASYQPPRASYQPPRASYQPSRESYQPPRASYQPSGQKTAYQTPRQRESYEHQKSREDESYIPLSSLLPAFASMIDKQNFPQLSDRENTISNTTATNAWVKPISVEKLLQKAQPVVVSKSISKTTYSDSLINRRTVVREKIVIKSKYNNYLSDNESDEYDEYDESDKQISIDSEPNEYDKYNDIVLPISMMDTNTTSISNSVEDTMPKPIIKKVLEPLPKPQPEPQKSTQQSWVESGADMW